LCVGAVINELEDEDARLASPNTNRDDEWIYMEKTAPEIHFEMWELNEEDLNLDFDDKQDNPSGSLYHVVQEENSRQIIKWILLFLCLWSSYCCVSDKALDVLIHFISAVFQSIGTIFPTVAGFALIFPKSLNLLRKQLGIDKDNFTKYVVCKKCESMYEFQDCYFERLGRTVVKKCPYVEYQNHRQAFRRTACNEPLLKEVILKDGKKRLYPFKVYCYNSIIKTIKSFIARQGFIANCEMWRDRKVPSGFLADVFDGKVWKDFMYVNGQPFLALPNNYTFMLNVDWFQPFKHSLYSVGALYMVLMNLPRDQRFKAENVMLVGIIPGPHEPKLTINSYLKPLVTELNILWKDGIQVEPPGSRRAKVFHAALLCVGCDVPAARKVCGFTGHGSCHGCSKCTKVFPGNVSDKIDFSCFDPCPPRTNEQHRQQAEDILNQTSATDKAQKESHYGTRFTELMMLPYFNCVRFHIIDPMHNLFTGTAKHIMKNIWLADSEAIINKKTLTQIQQKVDNVIVPSSVGRLPKKISNSYGGFTADQWKSWTIIYSIFALWNILPQEDMDVWREFVVACSILCTSIITETKARLGHCHLIKFCTSFEELYGKNKVTPNMHLHSHLLECILDFGPVYSFWLFSFERYNGILGEYPTNQRSVELQIMRKFMSEQFVKSLPLPTKFKELFDPIFQKLKSSNTGTLQAYSTSPCDSSSNHIIQQSLFSIGPVQKGLQWTISSEISKLYSFMAPISKYCIDYDSLPYLNESYKAMFNDVNESSITENCERISSISFGGEHFGSRDTRKERSAFILARWCAMFRGEIDKSGLQLRSAVVNQFIRQNIEISGQYHTCVLASVRWFKQHPARHALGAPVEVWCKDLFEDEGPA
jgi:hypothetical protein